MPEFNEIPASIRKPGQYLEIDWRGALTTLPNNAEKCLIIAPIAETGATATPLTIYDVFSTAEADGLFGAASPAAQMVRAAITANKYLNLSVCPLANDAVTVSGALAAIAGAGHTMIASSLQDAASLALFKAYLNDVSSAIEQRPALLFAAATGAIAAAVTLAGGANDGRINIAYLRGTTTTLAEIAAAFMAVAASEQDPARPLNTLEIKGIAIPAVAQWLTRTEQETLLANGVTPFETTADGLIRIVRAITTYTKNAQGTVDASKLDITSVRSADYVRKAVRTAISLKFPREKASERIINAVWGTIYDTLRDLEKLEIVQGVDDYINEIVVEKSSLEAGRYDAVIPAPLVPGFHVFAGQISIHL
jgi:phage tail sheath gpL-like